MVFPAGPGAPEGTLAALGRQARRPDQVVVLGSGASVHTALAGECEWLWLLDHAAVPEPGALEQLLEAVERTDPPPVLLASKVVNPDGSLNAGSLPVPEVYKADQALAALDRRSLAIRVARRGSLLVHRRGFAAPALADAGWPLRDDIGWTARLLKHEPGLLVPSSVVVLPPADGNAEAGSAREVVGWLRLATGDALEPRERPWFAFRFAERALAALRARLTGLTKRP